MGSRFCLIRVPQQHVFLVQLFGKYHKTLYPGLNFIIPFIQRVAHEKSLKQVSIQLGDQSAVTKDNVTIKVDGVIYLKVVDPYKASYGAMDSIRYTNKLAQSITRSEIGKLTLDETFESRDLVNQKILQNIQHAIESWGIECIRFEVKDIKVSDRVKKIMALEAESERIKRAEILKSEATKTATINEGIAQRASYILEAEGKAQEIKLQAEALATRIDMLNQVVNTSGSHSLKYNLVEKYIKTTKALKGKNILVTRDLENMQDGVQRNIDNIIDALDGKGTNLTVVGESWSDKLKKMMK